MQKLVDMKQEELGLGSHVNDPRLAGSSSMSAIRTWKYPRINKYFTVACFVTPPIVGSVVSVIYNGGALWCLLEVMRGRYSLAREPHFVATAAAL